MPPRSLLYDEAWIDKGCQNEWPPGTNKDTEFLTWATCYLMMGTAVAGFVVFWGNPFGIEYDNTDRYIRKFALQFFLVTLGIAAFLDGVDYQFYDMETQSAAMTARAGDAFLTLSMAGLLLSTSLPLTGGPEYVEDAAKVFRRNLCILVYGLYAAVTLLVSVVPSGVYAISDGMRVDNNEYRTKGDQYFARDTWSSWISGAVVCLTCLAMIVSQFLKSSHTEEAQAGWVKRPLLVVFAAASMVFGLAVQQGLSDVCGSGKGGYGVCWKDCPLPAPDFNHNAAYHCFMAGGVATIIVAVSETFVDDPEPEPEKQPLKEEEPEPEPAKETPDVLDEGGWKALSDVQ